jgi:hypothetical protein
MTLVRTLTLALGGIISLAASAALGGCTGTTSTGQEYVLKIDRELEGYVDCDLRTAHVTSMNMLEEDYLYEITYEALDAREGIVEARTAKDRFVRIETYRAGIDRTKVQIYVSPMGDYRAERDIFEQLQARLGGSA